MLVDRASSGLLSNVETMQPASRAARSSTPSPAALAAGNHFGRYDIAHRAARATSSPAAGSSRPRSTAARFTYLQTPYDEDGEQRCQDPQGTERRPAQRS